MKSEDFLIIQAIRDNLEELQASVLLLKEHSEALRDILFAVVAADKSATNENYLTGVKLEFWDILGERVTALLYGAPGQGSPSLGKISQERLGQAIEDIKARIDDLQSDLQ